MRHARAVDVPLSVDRSSGVSLGEQLVGQVRDLVARGVLCAGDPLPSSRVLAERLGISRGTVVTAWDVLAGEGYLTADRGATRIAPGVRVVPAASELPISTTPPRSTRTRRSVPDTGQIDLRPGKAVIAELDTPAWRGAWRDAASADAGAVPLRQHLADYLRLNRGVVREPDDIVITAGARDGLQLVLRVLGALRGRRLRVAVEDPGYSALRRVVEATGHIAIPIPVDEFGLNPGSLPTGEWAGTGTWDVVETPDAVVVTPGHQYPLGGTMPVSRRLELLRWARGHRAVVIEDDYDSELRYTGQPLPALAALDADRDTVVTLGSFTKVLGNGVGVGHLVAPDDLLPRLHTLRAELGSPVSAVAQRAIARFMDSGHLQRHTARMRRAYRRRRSLIAHALADLPDVAVVPMAGGSHAVIEVPDEAAAVTGAAQRGVLVSGLGEYWAASASRSGARAMTHARDAAEVAPAEPRADPREGLVLGLTAADADLEKGMRVLRDVLKPHPRKHRAQHGRR
ncbi:PLP-dependent aminotransferase family protein [Kocuria carniphila]|uniref:MocR-like pyridoxine biosynthesis transcription factor PdxR n=1 Tax=Kocuria carniphila TaxID=262208 RepID=UPI0034DB0372